MNTTPTSGAADLPEALINIAREIEALKRDCGMDPESAIAIQNGRYMAISSEIRALAAGQATAAQAVVPAGWKLVPEQPALSMLIKGSDTDTSTSVEDCRRVYRAMLAAAPAQPAAQQGVAYAALPESFLEIPDVQDESGINAYYSREVVLECIDAALASHGQAPVPPPECETEAEKRAFAFGWFKALESERMKADNKKKDPL